jgi:hypothetical protein
MTLAPIQDNPVGWSSIYPPDRMSNPDPDVSPVASRALMSDVQRLGLLGRRGPVTGADLPAVESRGQGLMDNAITVAGAVNPVGIRAFHASPHKFEQFDMSRIGTGTGLHAYSPGAYFASAENNARGYGSGLSSTDKLHSGQIFTRLNRAAIDAGLEPGEARQVAGNVISGIMDAGTPARYLRNYDIPSGRYELPYKRAIEEAKRLGVVSRSNMYEVNLNVNPDDLLNWNAAANAQTPRISDRLRNAGVNVDSSAPYHPRTRAEVAQLRDAGIPGLRYTGEGATEAAPNYVMFDDKLIDILRRYGLLGMLGGGAAGGGLLAQEPAQ